MRPIVAHAQRGRAEEAVSVALLGERKLLQTIIFFNYKTQTTNKIKRVYTQPSLIVEEVMVESGIAASAALVYGDPGYAGSNGSVTVYDYDDL